MKRPSSESITLTIPQSVENRNGMFYFLALSNCDTEEKRRIAKAYVKAANKRGWYMGDLVDAVNEIIESQKEDNDVSDRDS